MRRILIVLVFCYSIVALHSQNINCGPFDANGVQYCEVGIPSSIINVVGFDTQYMNQWCWAASIQAVFEYHGHEVSQQRIVRETFGNIVNWPAQPHNILNALNKTWVDDNGYTFNVNGVSYNANAVTAAQDLANGYPLIIGTMGHAMVLTAMSYYRDGYGNGSVQSATVRDPWPMSPGRRQLSAQEWASTSFLVRIRVY